ncbi:MAG: hypothetical protein HPY83_07550 [Anaerolineae bacterium]|nr:hypothetical protein [Anaerolineae bacterium]
MTIPVKHGPAPVYMGAGSDAGFFRYVEELADRIAEAQHNGVNHCWRGYLEHQPPYLNRVIWHLRVYTRMRLVRCEVQGHERAQVIEHCRALGGKPCTVRDGTRPLGERWNREGPG